MKNNNTKNLKYKEFNEKILNEILEVIVKALKSPEFLKKYATNEKAFTRKSPLNIIRVVQLIYTRMIATIAVMLIKASKELFTQNLCIFNKDMGVTKQAFSKARYKVAPELFVSLNDVFIAKRYECKNNKTNVLLFKNKYILIAIDGSTGEIPNTKENREEFGHTTSQEGAKQLARASISTAFDVLNNITLDAYIGKYPQNERESAKIHINNICKNAHINNSYYNSLYIFDRGYYSKDLLAHLLWNKAQFLFRLPSTSLRNYVSKMTKNDEYIYARLSELPGDIKGIELKEYIQKNNEVIRLRLTKIELANGTIEILLSGLDMNEVSYDEMKALYFKRWKIETNYAFLKNILLIENFSGKYKIAIEQDFYSTVLISNIEYAFKTIVDYKIKKEEELKKAEGIILKHSYQANKNILDSMIRQSMFDLIYASYSKRLHIIENIVAQSLRYKVARSDGSISKPRKHKKTNGNKYKQNYRINTC